MNLDREQMTDRLLEFLNSHASVRRYTEEPVTDEQIDRIIETAQRAPTSSNMQAYSIIVVRDPKKKDRLADLSGNQQHVRLCPVMLIFCPDLLRLRKISIQSGHRFREEFFEYLLLAVVDAALAGHRVAVGEPQAVGERVAGAVVLRVVAVHRQAHEARVPAVEEPDQPVRLLLHDPVAVEVQAKRRRSLRGSWMGQSRSGLSGQPTEEPSPSTVTFRGLARTTAQSSMIPSGVIVTRVGGSSPIAVAATMGGYLDRMNTLQRLYQTLASYVYAFYCTDSYDTTARRIQSELESLQVRLECQEVQFRGWIGTIAEQAELFDAALAVEGPAWEHAFYLKETAEQTRYLMSTAEETLAADAKAKAEAEAAEATPQAPVPDAPAADAPEADAAAAPEADASEASEEEK